MKKLIYILGVIIGLSLIIIACEKQDNAIEPEDTELKAKKAKKDKINVCHLKGNGNYKIININKNALPAHLAHGDMVVFGETGKYVLDFLSGTTHYVHDMEITDNSFSGTGGYPSGGPYTITWTVSGTIDNAGNISFTIDYDNSNYYGDVEGLFECGNGYGGTWSNDTQSGTWTGYYVVD